MLHPTQAWYSLARDHLTRLWRDPCGWGDGAQDPPCPEPTVLACLALLSADDESALPDTLEMVDASAQWLSERQRADGAVGTVDEPPSLCRSTACAALLWGQLLHYRRPLANALRWLQQCDELAPEAEDDEVLGHCPTQGAWLPSGARCSLLEPAAIAILSLCRNQLAGHQRITDTLRRILEQSLASGGWHARTAIPSSAENAAGVVPTGMVLLALRAAGLAESEEVTRACRYLEGAMPHALSPGVLSWGLLGYLAWRPRPAGAPQWLSQCYADTPDVAASPAGLALLMLADRPRTFSLLGISPAGDEAMTAHLLLPEFLAV